jgi:thioredoxin reductase (NADPH)
VILVVGGPDEIAPMAMEFIPRYSCDYTIETATSAASAAKVARALVDDGTPVAMFVVAPDLPDAGVTEAMTNLHAIVPTARRLCVVVWADFFTVGLSRLRSAVANGVLDSYLGLPRGPRDEEFHTAVVEYLSEWGWSVNRPEVDSIQIVADAGSVHLARIVDIFQRMGIPHSTYPRDSAVGREISALTDPEAPLPLLRATNGQVYARPSVAEIGAALYGTSDTWPPDYVADLLVVGGGPAGLGAAVYGASEGLETVVVEAEAIGGQAGTSSMIRNYLGFPRGISGMRLAQRARLQALRFGARFLLGRPIVALRPGDPHTATLDDGSLVRSRVVVIASGAAYRRLGVESIENFVGRGVHYGAAMSVAKNLVDATVFVVGGGNSAGQAAVHLARFTPHVTMLVRRDGLTETMSDYLIREVTGNPRITVRTCCTIIDGGGDGHLQWLRLCDTESGEHQQVPADALLLLLGADPCTDWLPGELARDDTGFLLTGRRVPKSSWVAGLPPEPYATTVPGIYAVGDVRSGSMKRVASAAGEGAAVVPLVHAYLADRR